MNKLIIKLKQHTPLIHFQHDQEGATLRASEVKPKLDRFILNKLGESQIIYEKGLIIAGKKNPEIKKISKSQAAKNCLSRLGWVRGDSDALDYRLKIKRTGNYQLYLFRRKREGDCKNIKYITPCPYFGDDDVLGILSDDLIELSFISYEKDILDCIKDNIIHFFVYTNFGNRQSKGFGCFSVVMIDNEDVKSKTYDVIEKSSSKIYYKITNKDLSTIFSTINSEYQLLKSGQNHYVYKKSKLFEYMKNNNLRWEKRKIKLHLKDRHPDIFDDLKYDNRKSTINQIEDSNEQDSNEEFVYARAVLGLAENIEFTTYNGLGYGKNKLKVKISDNEEEIERYKSPLLFKVYDNIIYIIVEEINRKIYNKTFKFELMYNRNGRNVRNYLFQLNTPSIDQFNLIDFLDTKLIPMGWSKK